MVTGGQFDLLTLPEEVAMQLESGGLNLVAATVLVLTVLIEGAAPNPWRRDGKDYGVPLSVDGADLDIEDRFIDEQLKSHQNEMNLLQEAYRWLNNLEERKVSQDYNIGQLQVSQREQKDGIGDISHQVLQNADEIKILQDTVCELLDKLCENKQEPCLPCPWTTKAPPTTKVPTVVTVNVTLPTTELTTTTTTGTTTPTTTKPTTKATTAAPTTTKPVVTTRPQALVNGSCGEPDAPDNGYVDKQNTTLNAHCTLHCNTGYDLIGENTMICTAIWNDNAHNYQYSWAPPMSVICKANGKPHPATTTKKPVTTKKPAPKPTTAKPTVKPPTVKPKKPLQKPINSTVKPTKKATAEPEMKKNKTITEKPASKPTTAKPTVKPEAIKSTKPLKATKKNNKDQRMWFDDNEVVNWSKLYDSIQRRSETDTDNCYQDKKVGRCKAALPRFYYDMEEKMCKNFIYGGCGANGNNFETKEECVQKCENY